MGRTAFADPVIALQDRIEPEQGEDLDEFLIGVGEGAEFLLEGGKELALEAAPDLVEKVHAANRHRWQFSCSHNSGPFQSFARGSIVSDFLLIE